MLVTALVAGNAAAEVAAECPAHVLRWVDRCRVETRLEIEAVSCPSGRVRVRLGPRDGSSLDVEINAEPDRAFRRAGTLGVSPILQVAHFSEVPEQQRRWLATLIEWLPDHVEASALTEASRVVRSPEPATPRCVELPTWVRVMIALLTALLAGVYIARGFRSAPPRTLREGGRPSWDRTDLLWAGIVFVTTEAVAVIRAPRGIALHVDTVRDLLIVREWLEGPSHVTLGSVSSAGLHHGFLWHRVLAAWQRVDPSLAAVHVAIATTFALSALLLFAAIRRWTGRTLAMVGVAALLARFLSTPELFTPLWQPTLAPQSTCVIIFLAALAGALGDDGWSRVAFVAMIVATALASQIHLVFLLLVPGIVLARWRHIWLLAPLSLGILFLSWDLISHDALGVDFAVVVGGSAVETVLGVSSRQTLPEWQAATTIAVATVAVSSRFFTFRRRSQRASFMGAELLNVPLALFVVLGCATFGERTLLTRYWTPAFELSVVSLCVTIHGLVKSRFRRRRATWPPVLLVSIAAAIAVLGNIEPAGLTLRENDRILDELGHEGLEPDQAFRSVSSIPPLSEAFERGLWLRAPCQISNRRLGFRDAGRRVALLPLVGSGDAPRLERLRVIDAGEHRFGLLAIEPYIETTTFRVCPRDGEERDCYREDRAFPNPGWHRQCFVGDWVYGIYAVLARERREVDIELEVSIPADGSDHVVEFPSLAGIVASDTCRGRVVSVSGVSTTPREHGLVLQTTAAPQHGRLRVRWPWRDERCGACARRRPMPLVEMDVETFDRLNPLIEWIFDAVAGGTARRNHGDRRLPPRRRRYLREGRLRAATAKGTSGR